MFGKCRNYAEEETVSKKKLGFGCLGLIILAVIAVMLMPGGDQETEEVALPPDVTPSPAPPAPSFMEMVEFRRGATDVQWEQYAKEREGNLVEGWEGTVWDVYKAGERFSVTINVADETEYLTTADLQLTTDNVEAANWSKGTPVRFSGRIKEVGSALGEVTDVELEGATIEAVNQ